MAFGIKVFLFLVVLAAVLWFACELRAREKRKQTPYSKQALHGVDPADYQRRLARHKVFW
jgi:Na+-transporting methylmalonyl-CoA/oxaloacetate decarboxylase gamma subunit